MKSMFPATAAIFSAVLLTFTACQRTTETAAERPVPTAEDIRIGRKAISINEVSLLARTGFHKDALDAVTQRHIPEHLSAEEELQFKSFAKPELLAALKDPANILTPAQKDAYDDARINNAVQKEQLTNIQANRKQQLVSAATDKAWQASVAEQQEIARKEQLNREVAYEAERAKAEREARERDQLRSTEEKWRQMDAQNSYHRPYNTPIPNRRYPRPENRPNNPPR
ncbi:MAG TPA: hypothetical protein VM940_13480 [Chthoniobacterales bacterium]|jgi:hypothetical protein|nr:hypothetical protein [Chthoniobacterales bacterium]